MKRTKLLTSLSALLLIISVSACSLEDDDSIDTNIDEIGNPVVDMLREINTTHNFSLSIYYYEEDTDYFDNIDDAAVAPLDYYLDAQVDITFSEDVVILEYYYYGYLIDVEAYVNEYNNSKYGTDITWLYYLDENYKLYNTGAGFYGTWEQSLYSPLSLTRYASSFNPDFVSSGDYGVEIDYPINQRTSGFVSEIVYDMFYCNNWYVDEDFVGGPVSILSLISAGASSYYDIWSTYYVDLEAWDICINTIYAPVWGIEDDYGNAYYWAETDYMESLLYNVGTAELPAYTFAD